MRSWRVPLRIARREALRAKGRTILMLVMIALPVMGVTAADVIIQTQDVNSVESLDRRLGTEAAAKVSVWGTRVVPMEQSRDPESGYASSLSDSTRKAPTLPQLLDALGEDRRGISYDTTDVTARTDRGATSAGATVVDLADPLARGLLELDRGRLPQGPDEAVVNQALADRGPGLGETLSVTVRDSEGESSTKELTVVGIGESTTVRSYEQVFGLPGSLGDDLDSGRSWLVSGGPVRWDAVERVNALGGTVVSRAEILDPSPAAKAADDLHLYDSGIDQATLTVVILVVVMALIEVVLLAGPAFAVGARRQARSLALLASCGGTPAQARRVILATGVVVGTVGAAVGVVLGIVLAAALVPVLQSFDGSWFGPFEVPWLHLVGVAAFGFLSALLAAVVPAWIASRQDVVAVLAGRRGDRRPSTRSPILGVGLLVLGAGIAWLATSTAETSSALLIGLSAILSVFGMLFVVPVVVVGVARAGRWFPLALRFAVRDAARHRTRTTPAVAAVAATVAGVVALGIGVSSDEAQNRETYQPSLAMGAASVSADTESAIAPPWQEYAAVVAREAPGARVHTMLGVPSEYRGGSYRSLSIEVPTGDDSMMGASGSIGVMSTEVLAYDGELSDRLTEIDGFPREEATRVLDAGGVVVFTDGGPPVSEVSVAVTGFDEANGSELKPERRTVPALAVDVGGVRPGIGIVPAGLAEDLGMRATIVNAYVDGETITETQEKDISEALNAFPVPAYLYVERGYVPQEETTIIQLVLAGLGAVLMLGGTLTATFLALSDARPDLATLSAVGATGRTRRGVAAGYALAVGGVGALLGVGVGFIPGVAATYPLTSTSWCSGSECPAVDAHYLDVPWLLIGGLVVVLPLLVSGIVWLSARSRLPLVARLG